METIWIASDHAAFEEKQKIIEYLNNRYKIVDLGMIVEIVPIIHSMEKS